MKYTFICIALACLALGGCPLKTSDKIDADLVKETLKRNKIRRMTDNEVMVTAQEKGAALAKALQAGLPDSADWCGFTDFAPLKDAMLDSILTDAYFVCDSADLRMLPKAADLFKAYQAGFAKGEPIDAGLQKLDGETILYAIPKVSLKKEGKKTVRRLAMLNLILSKKQVIVSSFLNQQPTQPQKP